MATTSLGFAAGAAHAEDAAAGTVLSGAEGAAALAAADAQAIVVTARRRVENVQDVPIAISTLSGEQIEAAGAYRLDQIKLLTPSVQSLSLNPRNANINIRGLGANVNVTNDGLEQGVGFYVDDVYYGRSGQTQFDLVDLQQVEVLRGPQGTLFGKNTTAGAIVVSTKEPSFTPEGTIEVSGGNLGYQQLKAGYSAPIIEDKLAFRISAAGTHRDGYIHNVHTGEDIHDYNNFTVRGQLLATPTDKLKIRAIVDYGMQRQNCCAQVQAGKVTTRIDGTPLPNGFDARVARIGYTPLPVDPFSYNVDLDSLTRTQMYTGGVQVNADYDFGDFTLTSVTSRRFWNWKPNNDPDGISRPATVQGRIIDHQSQFSQELRLASNGKQTLDWVVGGYYFWQMIDGWQTSAFGPDAALFNLPPILYGGADGLSASERALASAALDGYHLEAFSRPTTKSYAAFGQGTWNITDQASLTAGVRYTHEDKTGVFSQQALGGAPLSSFAPADRATVALLRGIIGGTNAYNVDLSEDNISGLLTGTYKITPNILTYATYSRGYKSGGLNLVNLAPALPKTVKPEKVNHYELGLKSEWLEGNLTANLAAFWTDVNGYQTTIFDVDRLTTYISNVGSVRSRGIEADLRFRPFEGLSTYVSAIYDEAKFVSYKNAPPPIEYTGLLPPTANFIDLSDRPLPGAPLWAASVGGEYEHVIPGVETFLGYIGGDYSYRSSYYASGNDAASSKVGDYAILNARLGVRSESGATDVSIWAKNLGDTKYFEIQGGGNAGGSGLITGLVGQPRTYGVTLRQKFGG
ncbi:MAG: TonB-dependent receptor [Caulobacterales bacterium]